jgi:hypothetical protein
MEPDLDQHDPDRNQRPADQDHEHGRPVPGIDLGEIKPAGVAARPDFQVTPEQPALPAARTAAA